MKEIEDMKLRIFEKREEEKEIFLRLVRLVGQNSSIYLCAVDSKGDVLSGGYLLKFLENGRIYRMGSVSNSLGLPLDANDRIKFDDKYYNREK